jgi:hypothetical protein
MRQALRRSLCALVVSLSPVLAFQGLPALKGTAHTKGIAQTRRAAASRVQKRGAHHSSSARTMYAAAPRTTPIVETYEERLQALSSFEPTPYAAPWWAKNQHVNTIVGALFVTPPGYRARALFTHTHTHARARALSLYPHTHTHTM